MTTISTPMPDKDGRFKGISVPELPWLRKTCEGCGGSGLINTETGNPETNATAHRSDVDICLTCDGYGVQSEG